MSLDRSLPLLIGMAFAVLMIISRLLTNYHCKKRGKEMVAAGTTSGFIPAWISAFYLFGFVGLAVSCVWSFVGPAWWAPLVIVFLYFLTGLVHSRAADINLLIRFNARQGLTK